MRNAVLLLTLASALCACEEKKTTATDMPTTPSTAATVTPAMPATSAASAAMGTAHLTVTKGKGTFLIDAPLEKIKGASDDAKGSIDLNPMDLAKSTGEVRVHLTALKTMTFGDKDKD